MRRVKGNYLSTDGFSLLCLLTCSSLEQLSHPCTQPCRQQRHHAASESDNYERIKVERPSCRMARPLRTFQGALRQPRGVGQPHHHRGVLARRHAAVLTKSPRSCAMRSATCRSTGSAACMMQQAGGAKGGWGVWARCVAAHCKPGSLQTGQASRILITHSSPLTQGPCATVSSLPAGRLQGTRGGLAQRPKRCASRMCPPACAAPR